eukprot:c21982_g1_i3.p1 GENE.c21982_g1_i3~~c21982_g1_i3.p1  ORF type:complete len:965 (+),score=519.38 c21982_g1_i3:80-2974(+)
MRKTIYPSLYFVLVLLVSLYFQGIVAPLPDSETATSSDTATSSESSSETASATETGSQTESASETGSSSETGSVSATVSSSSSVSETVSATVSASVSETSSSSASVSETSSGSASATGSPSNTVSPSNTPSPFPEVNVVTVDFILSYTGATELTPTLLNLAISNSLGSSFGIPPSSIAIVGTTTTTAGTDTDAGTGMEMGMDAGMDGMGKTPSVTKSPTTASPTKSPASASPTKSVAKSPEGMGMAGSSSSGTPSSTNSPNTLSPTRSPASETPSRTLSSSPSPSKTGTTSDSSSRTASKSMTSSSTASKSMSASKTEVSQSQTPSSTRTISQTQTSSKTETPSKTPTKTQTPSNSPSKSLSGTNTPTKTETSSNSPSKSLSASISESKTSTRSVSESKSSTSTLSGSKTAASTPSTTKSSTSTPSATKTAASATPSGSTPSGPGGMGMGKVVPSERKSSGRSIRKADFVLTFTISFVYYTSENLTAKLEAARASIQSGFNITGYTLNTVTTTIKSQKTCAEVQDELDNTCLGTAATGDAQCTLILSQSICFHAFNDSRSQSSKTTCSVDIEDILQVDDYYYEQCTTYPTVKVCPCVNGGFCNRTGSCTCLEGFSGVNCSDSNKVASVVSLSLSSQKSCESFAADSSEYTSYVASFVGVPADQVVNPACQDKSTKASGSTVTLQIVVSSDSDVTVTQITQAVQTITTIPALGITIVVSNVGSQTGVTVAYDCNGSPYGRAVLDLCGVCGGSNDCIDCTGRIGDIEKDVCGVCGGIATTTADCITTSSGKCVDNSTFVDEVGLSCANWYGYECALAQVDWQYSASSTRALLRNCPYSCRQCVGDCIDNSSFVDEGGLKCSSWVSYDCTTADVSYGYSSEGVQKLLKNCKYSCNLCSGTSNNTTTSSEKKKDENSIPSAIIGGVIGGVVAAALGLVAFACYRKSNKKDRRSKIPQSKAQPFDESVL